MKQNLFRKLKNKSRKIILLLSLSFTVSVFSNGQELGIRWGDVVNGDWALDGVFNAGKLQRVHADISFGHGGVGLEALWDFLYKPLGGESINWYLGVGPSLRIDDPFWLGVSGELGLEYRFNNVPLTLSGDWRPAFYIVEETDFRGNGFGINLRYVFGKK